MTFIEDAVKVLRDHDNSRPRSLQAEIGWSEVGGCRAYMGFRLDEAYPEDTDTWAAQRGTALDEYAGPVLAAALGARYQVPVTYRGIPGHADLLHSEADWVTDMKAPELGNAKAWAADPSALWQKRVQVHGYAAGGIEAGLLTEGCTVRLLVMPSGGTFADWWTWEEPFDRALADAGAERLAEVRARRSARRLPAEGHAVPVVPGLVRVLPAVPPTRGSRGTGRDRGRRDRCGNRPVRRADRGDRPA